VITAKEAADLANNANKVSSKAGLLLLLKNICEGIKEAAAEGKYSITYFVDIGLVLS
jgi:hypothetical protein